MPNWMTNRITISGPDIKNKISKYITTEESGHKELDFQKIVPMPKELDIERGSLTFYGTKLLITKLNPFVDYYGEPQDKVSESKLKEIILLMFNEYSKERLDKITISKEDMEKLLPSIKEKEAEYLEAGEIVLNNFRKYGYSDWYDWRLRYWGCKWNACETYVSDDFTKIYFDTPWTHPEPVIRRLAELNPDLKIVHEYAEEQTAFICGVTVYENGEVFSDVQYDSYSKEAYELYFDLWGEDEMYVYNEKLGNYVYVEDEG